MDRLPERLVIIGGGIMAAEFAYIFSRFGSRVSILARSGFLKNLDEHLRKRALRELAGVNIREGTEMSSADGRSGDITLSLKTAGGIRSY